MNIDLNQILDGATAIPYSDTLISTLDTACHTYKIENELERVDELVVGFVTGIIPNEFKKHIEEAMREQEFHEIPTNDVLVRLAQYIVIETILENEDELNKAICASKLMNYMLVTKALKRPIPNADSLLEVYEYHISEYLKDVDTVPEDIQTDIRTTIPAEDFPLEISEEDADALRLILKEAELYRIEHWLTSDEIQDIESPFVKVYIGLSKMFDHLAYCFYNIDLKKVIRLLLNNTKKTRKKLSNIIEELVQSKCEFNANCSETSVILSMIKGKNQVDSGNVMLTIEEFAVYLYYELLTEKIIAIRN
ncbi:hypothetical protein B5G09_11130 [Alistipes sp. An54]|uniref:hypothetical protein n=1 Tax=Alistipes sp. An54 TaxID=1965645 RepID=UPI000B3898C9|nr:hypothetical protein [Alistipes sp. An54]OUN76205.1 hypothetical protein B5G09_11130 [Alistipes sp. An54]